MIYNILKDLEEYLLLNINNDVIKSYLTTLPKGINYGVILVSSTTGEMITIDDTYRNASVEFNVISQTYDEGIELLDKLIIKLQLTDERRRKMVMIKQTSLDYNQVDETTDHFFSFTGEFNYAPS